ncbi:MAG: hypothetical protein ACLUNO_03885 [Oscillospiraceae bacterium]
MMYQALYRKYRPKTFDDVVGQEHITETLKKQVETGRLSHAYLFIGTRGHRQDHLCQDPGQGGQLRASGQRQSVQPMRRLPRHRRRVDPRRG